MKTLAILPMKSFDEAKGRLRAELQPAPRRALAESMFSDVLVALRRTASIDQVLVVSSDHGAQRIAGGYGAEVLEDSDRGHNQAAALGIARALELGAERVLLIPGDCPILSPTELDELMGRAVSPPSVLIVPDRHGTGTNALVLAPPDALEPSFGPDSCERHAAHAREAGIAGEVVAVPSLALDVDTPEDLATVQTTLAATRGGAAHTRGMLRQLLRSQT
jgi:2-phospho-L-lactate guanylyltransferase